MPNNKGKYSVVSDLRDKRENKNEIGRLPLPAGVRATDCGEGHILLILW